MSRRKSEAEPLGDVIRGFLRENQIEDRYDAATLIDSWEKVMGKSVANRTEKIYVNNKILFVQLSSAPLRNKLHYDQDKIVKLLNESFSRPVVEKVVFR